MVASSFVLLLWEDCRVIRLHSNSLDLLQISGLIVPVVLIDAFGRFTCSRKLVIDMMVLSLLKMQGYGDDSMPQLNDSDHTAIAIKLCGDLYPSKC
nr:hypothetical protein Iba_chr04aCG25030 [Ipomoea batatas]GMC87277.1 hypothetical protein Iba_chr04dCG18630 [Ipomoea batatas]